MTIDRNQLLNLNRTVVLLLTLCGLLSDGFEGADGFFMVASFICLWLPALTRVEARLVAVPFSHFQHILFGVHDPSKVSRSNFSMKLRDYLPTTLIMQIGRHVKTR